MLDFIIMLIVTVTIVILGFIWAKPFSKWFDRMLDKFVSKLF